MSRISAFPGPPADRLVRTPQEENVARILVADDDVDIRELVEFKLSTMGHDIVAVGDGAAAIDACMAEKPDLAVLDVMMPGVSGLDAIRAIRAEPALADLPVILLTARAQESDVETGFDSGADDYITKPFSPRELASRVQALLSRSR
ncbi:MAG: response regulator transcription factor [Nocardioides sp.]